MTPTWMGSCSTGTAARHSTRSSLSPEGIQLFGDNDGENEPLLVGGVAI
jgi:hypothetical protein